MVDRLTPREWFRSIQLLNARLSEGQTELESALRHTFHLLQLAPGPVADMFGIPTSEEHFEGWLENESLDVAARAIVADHLPITVSVPGGHAKVKVEGLWFEASAERSATTVAMATLRAWVGCVLDIQEKAADNFFSYDGPTQLVFRSARHPRSTAH